MPYLNQQDRDDLRRQLLGMKFNRAKGRVRGMDRQSRLLFLRNSQSPTTLHTTYELPSLGVRVTLIESQAVNADKGGRLRPNFDLMDVLVEPTPDNRT